MANPMEGFNTFRTPLAPLARDFYAHGFQHPGPWIREVENRSNPDELFEHGKPEAYALAAVLSAEVMRRMTTVRPKLPPYGVDTKRVVKEKYGPITTRQGLRAAFTYLFEEHSEAMTRDLEASSDPNDRLVSVYERYKKWMPILHPFEGKDETGEEVPEAKIVADDLSMAAIHGGLGFMSGVLHDIPAVWERQYGYVISPELHVSVARASYKTVANMAANHTRVLHAFQKIERMRSIHNTSHELYTLQGNDNRLEFSELAVQEISQRLRHSPESIETTVGCPALVVFQDSQESVIHELWSWMVDVHEMATVSN